MLVDTFLNSVYLYDDDHLVLVMNYSGENCKVDLKLVEGAVSGDGCKGSAFAPSSAVNECSCKSMESILQLFFYARNLLKYFLK